MVRVAWVVIATACMGAPVMAQDAARPFTGPSAGLEAGYLEHHFNLEFEESAANGDPTARYDRYYRSHGVGGGAFAGYDLAASPRWRLGAEVAVSAGGASNTADFGRAGSLRLDPRFGLRGVVRAGYVVTPRLMGYASLGYGGNRYRVRDTVGVEDSRDLRWGSSFVVGAGAEYRLTRRIG